MLVLILVALLPQKSTLSRARDSGVSTWQSVKVFRPGARRAARRPRGARPRGSRSTRSPSASAVGLPVRRRRPEPARAARCCRSTASSRSAWSSSPAGPGRSASASSAWSASAPRSPAASSSTTTSTSSSPACSASAAGAVAAVVIGLPAIRIQGLYLAVTTLAFGYAMENYVLNERFFHRPAAAARRLHRRICAARCCTAASTSSTTAPSTTSASPRSRWSMAAALAFRNNRSGRVVIAVRDNQRAAASYAMSPVKVRLAAFAVSGGIAGLAGTLFAYLQHDVIPGSYDVLTSIFIFLAASVAGLTSVWAAVVGVVLFQASVLFGPNLWQGLGADLRRGRAAAAHRSAADPEPVPEPRRPRGLRLRGARQVSCAGSPPSTASTCPRSSPTGSPDARQGRRRRPARRPRSPPSTPSSTSTPPSTRTSDDRPIVCPVCHDALTLGEAAGHDHLRRRTPRRPHRRDRR